MYTQEDWHMILTRVFQNGNSQAIRIPQEMHTDEKEYFISKIGDIYLAYPAADPWASVKNVIGTFPSDFMSDREQPAWNDVDHKEDM